MAISLDAGLQQSRIKPGTKLISINSVELHTKSNYQDFQRFQVVDVGMAADAEATLPSLIEAVRSALPNDRKDAIAKRGEDSRKAKAQAKARTLEAAAIGWDASPISTARLCAELYAQIKDEDWSLASPTAQVSYWPQRLWTMEKPYQFIGDGGGMGITGIGPINDPSELGPALKKGIALVKAGEPVLVDVVTPGR